MGAGKKQARGDRQRGAQMYRGRTSQTLADKQRLRDRKQSRKKQVAKEKRSELLWRVVGVIKLVMVVLVVIAAFSMLQIRGYRLENIDQFSANDQARLVKLTDEYVTGFTRFKFTFNASAFEQHMLERTGFLAAIDADTALLSPTLTVHLTPKTPAFAYVDPTQASQNDIWVAEDGSLITQAAVEEPPTEVELVNRTGVEYTSGDNFISQSDIGFILAIMRALEGEGAIVNRVTIGDVARQLEVSLVGEKYDLLLSTERPVESIITDYKAAQETISQKNLNIKQYIDLRVVDKVFYR